MANANFELCIASDSRVAKSTFATLSIVELLYFNKLARFVLCYNHLCYALAVVYNKLFLRKIYENYANLTTIVSVNSSGSIQYGYAMFQCKSTARAHLGFISNGKSNVQSGWH